MLALYYCPGACSMAAHIVLEESGEKYEPKPVNLAAGEQRSEAYLKVNPQGRVPVLRLDTGEPLAENTAILPYLGKRFGLWPTDPIAEAKALSLIGFFAASVHPAHAHIGRPERYASDPSAFETLKETGRPSTAICSRSTGCLPAGSGFPTATRFSIPTLSFSTPGAFAASCRWRRSKTTRHSRTA